MGAAVVGSVVTGFFVGLALGSKVTGFLEGLVDGSEVTGQLVVGSSVTGFFVGLVGLPVDGGGVGSLVGGAALII